MPEKDCYRINTPTVAFQIIDDEVVMIHFDTGCYYSSNVVGTRVLKMIESKTPFDRIIAALVAAFDVDEQAVRSSLDPFFTNLETEQLIVACDSAGNTEDESDASNDPGESGDAGEAFAAPVLEKYNDLQDLLLLDPIHDTTEAGWPQQPTDS